MSVAIQKCLTIFVYYLTSLGIDWCIGCASEFEFLNIFTFISGKSLLVSVESDNNLIIVSSLFATVLPPRIHKVIEFISKRIIFCLN